MKFISYSLFITTLLIVSPAYAGGVVCADFGSQSQAQDYFNAKKPGYKSLDRDKDGIACESLP